MEARAEIEGAVLMQTGGGHYEVDSSGSINAISYRDKLAQMKSKRVGGQKTSAVAVSSTASSAAMTSLPALDAAPLTTMGKRMVIYFFVLAIYHWI